MTAAMIDPPTARAEIDLGAFRANLLALAGKARNAALMVVVKADGYGHGMLACAREVRAAGVPWLGVATPAEALALRADEDAGRLLCWLYGIDTDLTPLVAADVDVSAQSVEQISRLVAAAGTSERVARVHLKADTGLSRNGASLGRVWDDVCAAAAEAESVGAVEVVAVWSHLAAADQPGHPSIQLQLDAFALAYDRARAAGLHPDLRHLANSASTLVLPESHFDLVRVGIAAYGIDPVPGLAARAGVTLRPVMQLQAQLVNVKAIDAGAGVSYGHAWVAPHPTTVGLVPLGYADGIPRHGGNRAFVGVAGVRRPIRGRICMDQFVVDLGAGAMPQVGEPVLVFGAGDTGEPTAADWALWCDTIGYEIVTRIGSRVPRVYVGASAELAHTAESPS